MVIVEVDGARLQLPGRAPNVGDELKRAIGTYLDREHQPNHVVVMSHRVDGWCRGYRRYDVYTETDTQSGRGRRHRYFDVTIYN